jgi:starvation-inducible DNA-binding protein
MALNIDIGLDEQARSQVSESLARLLADTFTLYLKTHNYHWNVTGPHFAALHAMFEQQYQELWLAADELAERMRALGHMAPGSYADFSELTQIAEADGIPSAMDMVADLAHGNEAVARVAVAAFEVSDRVGDQATADLTVNRQQVHEKTAWMLRSMLE